MADATFTIDADTKQLVLKAVQALATMKKVGDGVGQAGKKMADAGKDTSNAFEKAAASMGRTLIGAQAIAQALGAARDKAAELQAKVVQLGSDKGGFALRASRAAAAGGIDQRLAGAFMDQIGAATQEQRAGLVEGLAKADLNLSPQRFIEITSAVNSGAFTPDEALEAAKNGSALDIQKRKQSLSPRALREINTLTSIDAANARVRDQGGDAFRIGAALGDARDIANPGRAQIRAAVGVFDRTGLGAMGETTTNAKDAQAVYMERTAIATEKTAAAATQQAKNSVRKLDMSGVTDR